MRVMFSVCIVWNYYGCPLYTRRKIMIALPSSVRVGSLDAHGSSCFLENLALLCVHSCSTACFHGLNVTDVSSLNVVEVWYTWSYRTYYEGGDKHARHNLPNVQSGVGNQLRGFSKVHFDIRFMTSLNVEQILSNVDIRITCSFCKLWSTGNCFGCW